MHKLKHYFYSSLNLVIICGLLASCALPTMKANRYFQFDLALEINHQPYLITNNWHCAESLNLSEADGAYHSHWNASPSSYHVIKKVGSSYLIFDPPHYCGTEAYILKPDGKTYMPDIVYVRSITVDAPVEVYSENRTKGKDTLLEIKSGIVRQLESAAADTVISQEDMHLVQVLKKKLKQYQSVSAQVIPFSTLKKSDNLNYYFKDAKGIVIAHTDTHFDTSISARDGHQYFPVSLREIYPLRVGESSTIPLIKMNNFWTISSNDSNAAMTYFPTGAKSTDNTESNNIYNIGKPLPVTVSYEGLSISVLNTQQVYDSKKQLLIDFRNNYFPPILN